MLAGKTPSLEVLRLGMRAIPELRLLSVIWFGALAHFLVQPDQTFEQHPLIFTSQLAPAQVGVSFGFFACRMAPKTPMSLTGTVTHPPMEFQGETTIQQSWPVEQPVQRGDHTEEEVCSFVGYRLEDAFELVLGDWVFPYGTKRNCYSQKPSRSLNQPIFQLIAKQTDRALCASPPNVCLGQLSRLQKQALMSAKNTLDSNGIRALGFLMIPPKAKV